MPNSQGSQSKHPRSVLSTCRWPTHSWSAVVAGGDRVTELL